MNPFRPATACCLALLACSLSQAQVLVTDSGVQTSIVGPGAPAHTIGLQRHQQTIVLETGVQTYGLRYGVARDAKRPGVAIPGEGYIGMPQPADCNWYAGGFFDLAINGKSIGSTPVHSVTGRSSGGRGTADFVFDDLQAVVRVRFVALSGGDCLYAQTLLEPKAEIRSVRITVRCYPSSFVSDADRHVRTPLRDLKQGERATLDVAREWWTLYYDRIYDAGHVSATHRGVGPCAVLWLPSQTEKAAFTVASYGIDTAFTLKPALRDFRFVFFDYAGTKNEAAQADLRRRAPRLLQELTTFAFTAPSLAGWSLPQKQAELRQAFASLQADKNVVAQYERWARELSVQLKLVQGGSAGAIMAEAEAARTIAQWERSLPELKLKALLNEI
jgi:hypothetical protein